MRALITGTGRSGTLWTASALRYCCGVEAHHETVTEVDQIGDHVEVNSFLVLKIRPDSNILMFHLVRDGRDVVSSILDRQPAMEFRDACEIWSVRNRHVSTIVPDTRRFLFERLLKYRIDMGSLAEQLGGRLDPRSWEKARFEILNMGGRSFPYWRDWNKALTDIFWKICGELMTTYGYERSEP